MAQTISAEDLGKDQTNRPGPGQPLTISGQPSSGNAPQSQASSNPNQTKGSGYTNIQKVLQANAGNKLGQTIGSNIQSAGNTAQDNLKQAQQQFQQGTQQNQANSQGNQQFVQNQLGQYSGNNQAPVNDPSQQDVSRFQTLLSGQYQGPTNLENSQQIQNQAANVGQMGQALNTAGGRMGLLNQVVGKPQYTSGQRTLDNLLLGQSNDPSLQAAKRQALTLQGKVGNAVTGAQAQGQQQTAQAQTFGKDVQNQFGQNVQSQYAALQNAAQKAQAQRDAQNSQLQSDLTSGILSADEAQQLGIQNGQMMYNIDPTKFINPSTMAANAQNVASTQDYARLQALQKLSGQYAPQQAQDTLGKFSNPSQAGQFQATPAFSANKEGFQQAYKTAQDAYNAKLQPAQQSVDQGNQMIRLYFGRFSPEDVTEAKQQGIDVHNLMAKKYPGALGPGNVTGSWLGSNIQTANKNLKDTQNALNQSYGTNKYNVAQPLQNTLVQQPPLDLGLEDKNKIS